MMVVDDMASIPARKCPFMRDQPRAPATMMPMVIMEKMMVMAAMTGANPILRIFLNEKSSPRAKSRNITPICAHVSMFSWSTIENVNEKLGDTMKPAMI